MSQNGLLAKLSAASRHEARLQHHASMTNKTLRTIRTPRATKPTGLEHHCRHVHCFIFLQQSHCLSVRVFLSVLLLICGKSRRDGTALAVQTHSRVSPDAFSVIPVCLHLKKQTVSPAHCGEEARNSRVNIPDLTASAL